MSEALVSLTGTITFSGDSMPPSSSSATAWEYFIDELPNTWSTQEIQDHCNGLGNSGWRLLFLGAYSSTPQTVRAWFIREKVP